MANPAGGSGAQIARNATNGLPSAPPTSPREETHCISLHQLEQHQPQDLPRDVTADQLGRDEPTEAHLQSWLDLAAGHHGSIFAQVEDYPGVSYPPPYVMYVYRGHT